MIKTIYLTAYMDEIFEPAFESREDAEKFVEELNRQAEKSTNGSRHCFSWWKVIKSELVPAGTYNFCLSEGCGRDCGGYFFCGPCLEERQGSS